MHHCPCWQWGSWTWSQQECSRWSRRSCWRCRWWGRCPSRSQTVPGSVVWGNASYLKGWKVCLVKKLKMLPLWKSQATSKHITELWIFNMLGIPYLKLLSQIKVSRLDPTPQSGIHSIKCVRFTLFSFMIFTICGVTDWNSADLTV